MRDRLGALRAAAVEVMRRAYAPYSNFPVGAAGLVDDGRVVVGCNVENASYGVTLCAECGLVSALHATGGGRLVALSCVDGAGEPLMPCGRCRQLLWEHGGPELPGRRADRPAARWPTCCRTRSARRTSTGPAGDAARCRERLAPLARAAARSSCTRTAPAAQRVWTGVLGARPDAASGDRRNAASCEEAPDLARRRAGGRRRGAARRTPRVVVVDEAGAPPGPARASRRPDRQRWAASERTVGSAAGRARPREAWSSVTFAAVDVIRTKRDGGRALRRADRLGGRRLHQGRGRRRADVGAGDGDPAARHDAGRDRPVDRRDDRLGRAAGPVRGRPARPSTSTPPAASATRSRCR